MAFHVKQEWDEQFQSEHLCCSKLPRLHYEYQFSHQPTSDESAALPLFVPEPKSSFSDSTLTPAPTRVRNLFSSAQWQELELQGLIFKYMLVKAPIPAQLIEYIKKSLPDNNPAFYLHHPLQQYKHFQPGMLRTGYCGSSVDPEPGRCRRTDGKKWRCAKDVVAGQKYCERHMHRGRNRSRKPVESSTQPTVNVGLRTTISTAASTFTREATGHTEVKQEQGVLEDQNNNGYIEKRSEDGQTLRHFFDDWPRSQQEEDGINMNVNPETYPTRLSISIEGDSQQSSDFSLKLGTGNGENSSSRERNVGGGGGEGEEKRVGWRAGWGNHQMGGPLAEALRQPASSCSPTSVLLGELPRRLGSDITGVGT